MHDFIESLPKGYETRVGELGGILSSGEKQRIGLARAFINEVPILILDEPTSNLDTLNEEQILKAINENCEHRREVALV
ncbi:ATP-binding cassette domain-containing protein [Clostridium botulinum]|uniref:ATP-binding cassette domain-containing protein n=1 Tax=Clostridium botulinum TaxID=1491 RepID=A0A6B3WP33_CLOBO|nr:benzoate transporter [Clostridium botulinum]MBN3349667.1 benzoate transporter [Clostridium botulinum]MBN3353183.1 benzoate transporter [Clostridium botulinum]MBN3358566.1 benzoate transporter [Clostridium botulinum]MBN3365760.1 benzoate transporter [Clostridium botulinum]